MTHPDPLALALAEGQAIRETLRARICEQYLRVPIDDLAGWSETIADFAALDLAKVHRHAQDTSAVDLWPALNLWLEQIADRVSATTTSGERVPATRFPMGLMIELIRSAGLEAQSTGASLIALTEWLLEADDD